MFLYLLNEFWAYAQSHDSFKFLIAHCTVTIHICFSKNLNQDQPHNYYSHKVTYVTYMIDYFVLSFLDHCSPSKVVDYLIQIFWIDKFIFIEICHKLSLCEGKQNIIRSLTIYLECPW